MNRPIGTADRPTRRAGAQRLGGALLVLALTLPAAAHAQQNIPPPPAAGAQEPTPDPAAAAPEGEQPSSLPDGHVPTLSQKVEPLDHVRTGEVVKLQITADATLGDDVTIADQSFAPFEVHKKQARVEPPNGDKQRFVFELELLAFEAGDKPVPAINLRVVTKDNFVGTVKTAPVPFRVRGFLDNEPNAQPKQETKPVAVLQDNWIPIYILGVLAAAGIVALLTLLISRYLRNRKRKPAPPPPPRPPWEIAVEELAALRRKRQEMIDAGQGAQFVEQLNHVIRAYLGGRYHFDGLETTTDEMLSQLKSHDAGLGFTQEVGMFLGRCDLVKFAKVEPDADEVDLLFSKAQDLVHFSGPDETQGLTTEPEPPPGTPPGPTPAGPGGAGQSDAPGVPSSASAAPSRASTPPAAISGTPNPYAPGGSGTPSPYAPGASPASSSQEGAPSTSLPAGESPGSNAPARAARTTPAAISGTPSPSASGAPSPAAPPSGTRATPAADSSAPSARSLAERAQPASGSLTPPAAISGTPRPAPPIGGASAALGARLGATRAPALTGSSAAPKPGASSPFPKPASSLPPPPAGASSTPPRPPAGTTPRPPSPRSSAAPPPSAAAPTSAGARAPTWPQPNETPRPPPTPRAPRSAASRPPAESASPSSRTSSRSPRATGTPIASAPSSARPRPSTPVHSPSIPAEDAPSPEPRPDLPLDPSTFPRGRADSIPATPRANPSTPSPAERGEPGAGAGAASNETDESDSAAPSGKPRPERGPSV